MKPPKHLLHIALLMLVGLAACKTAGDSPDKSSNVNQVIADSHAASATILEYDLVIPKSNFSRKIIETLMTRRREDVDRFQASNASLCKTTENLVKKLATKLVAGSKLENVVSQTPSLFIALECTNKTVKLPETKSGVIWVYPELLKGFSTEDQVAALLAHEIIHYTRSHEEEREERLSNWMPFREDAVNRSRWDHEKEADRLSVKLLANAGLDPLAAADIPALVDKLMTGVPGWNQGQINFPIDSAEERVFKIKFEIKQNKLPPLPQTIGQMLAVKAELEARP